MRHGLQVGLGSSGKPVKRISAFTDIAGLAGSWDPTLGVTSSSGKVTLWNDQSASAYQLSNGPASWQPTLNASDAAFGGRASIQSDGVANTLLRPNAGGLLSAAGYTWFVAVRWMSLGTLQRLLSCSASTGVLMGSSATSARIITHQNVATGSDGTPSTSASEIVMVRWDASSSTLTMQVNGVTQSISNAPGTFSPGTPSTLNLALFSDFSTGSVTTFAAAKIGLVECYNVPLGLADARAVTRLMGSVTGIGVA